MNRVEKEFEQRRAKIVTAAKRMFIKYGFENVSLSQVGKEADFGKSTLYHYFKSKNELLYVVIRTHDLKRLKSCNNEFDKGSTPKERIYNYLLEYYNYVKKDFAMFMMTYHYDFLLYRYIIPSLTEELYERYEKSFKQNADILKLELYKGSEQGDFSTMEDKNYQLGYIMSTTRGLINFLFQITFVAKTMSVEEADNYFEMHLKMMLNNI